MPIFTDKKIAVWGYGQEGQSALAYLHSLGLEADVIIPDNENTLCDYDIVIKSPGISIYGNTYKTAEAKGVIFTTDTNIFLEEIQSITEHKPVTVAVTGTKGKSTTSALIAHILSYLGKSVKLGGNFGTPLTDFISEAKAGKSDYVIAEVSSYQAADLQTGFDVAVLNNLYPEHLNWHLTHENYYKDKLNLIKLSKIKILNAADERTAELASGFSSDAVYFNKSEAFHTYEGRLFYRQQEILSLYDTSLQGEHNLSNLAAVFTVLSALGIDVMSNLAEIKNAVRIFKPLPHRLEKVRGKGDFTFIDDSISTTPETAMAALEVFKDKEITLIAGGFDRGQDYGLLAEKIKQQNVRLVAMGTTGKRLFDEVTLKGGMASVVKNMREAVEMAKDISPKEAVILLSPAAPSYDEYKNFKERGEDFKQCVKS